MSFQPVKFYQTGTFTVGNRLLPDNERSVQSTVRRTNSLNSGHRACQGCGEALGARYAIDAAMEVTHRQLVAANATGCLEVFSTPYPETSWQIPWVHSLFGNTAAVATGIAAALRVKGRSETRVVARGGDGGRKSEAYPAEARGRGGRRKAEGGSLPASVGRSPTSVSGP